MTRKTPAYTLMERFNSANPDVWKYVFRLDMDGEPAVAEAVLCRYGSFKQRTVVCCSVQSGCPVGCRFCGTGKRFCRNLSADEIVKQIEMVFNDQDIQQAYMEPCDKLQIMFMSMGEPFLNYEQVRKAIVKLSVKYPAADLLVSTIVPRNTEALSDFLDLSYTIDKVGLQFSVHEAFDALRNELIPYKNKLTLLEMRDYGIEWWQKTGRKPYVNYCVSWQIIQTDLDELRKLFPPHIFAFTFSVICSKEEWSPACHDNHEKIQGIVRYFTDKGYDVRMFDPAGPDDIGAGCGMLWFAQRLLNGATWEEAIRGYIK